jgi:nucleotide-binding universal stress UspA family protein
VPVLTIGPRIPKNTGTSGAFHSVLFATDFSKPCEAAAPFAVSLAEENDAQLILLYVAPKPGTNEQGELPLGNLTQRLEDIVPSDAQRWCYPSAIVEYGDAADRILAAAIEHGADLIVMGVRDAAKHLGAATHLERATAHKVVAHAQCPVLTVRG